MRIYPENSYCYSCSRADSETCNFNTLWSTYSDANYSFNCPTKAFLREFTMFNSIKQACTWKRDAENPKRTEARNNVFILPYKNLRLLLYSINCYQLWSTYSFVILCTSTPVQSFTKETDSESAIPTHHKCLATSYYPGYFLFRNLGLRIHSGLLSLLLLPFLPPTLDTFAFFYLLTRNPHI